MRSNDEEYYENSMFIQLPRWMNNLTEMTQSLWFVFVFMFSALMPVLLINFIVFVRLITNVKARDGTKVSNIHPKQCPALLWTFSLDFSLENKKTLSGDAANSKK